MVAEQLVKRGIRDPRVIAAMEKVPRHLFLPEPMRDRSYDDRPCPIGCGQTISQPYMVAFMTELLAIQSTDKVLEIGTGSGYQTAVLAELARSVYSIERIGELSHRAEEVLTELGYRNVTLKVGDGSEGWFEEAPFDAILVAASAPLLPEPLLLQLKEGGRFVIPVGDLRQQKLILVCREKGRSIAREAARCIFVPLIGSHGWRDGEVSSDDDGEGFPLS
ncbi:MAG: protein-L-isoaspartate(D-aspartate) O-methyltransferase [Candidatus Omnitrophica bacterium]|nr:protein-L-isoaspartate(D-aspartate) O-methyltransferase [Candidatus Omnitrophota bacterium]